MTRPTKYFGGSVVGISFHDGQEASLWPEKADYLDDTAEEPWEERQDLFEVEREVVLNCPWISILAVLLEVLVSPEVGLRAFKSR